MLRFLFPYIMVSIIAVLYLYIRHNKLGPVVMKVNRTLFSRFNSDSFILIIVISAISYFLGRYELQSIPTPEDTLYFGPYTYVFFYLFLIIIVTVREFERPALREKGISSPRGFWKWDEIEFYRWSKNILAIHVTRGKKKRQEAWQINPDDKKEIENVLKSNIKKKSKRSKKSS